MLSVSDLESVLTEAKGMTGCSLPLQLALHKLTVSVLEVQVELLKEGRPSNYDFIRFSERVRNSCDGLSRMDVIDLIALLEHDLGMREAPDEVS